VDGIELQIGLSFSCRITVLLLMPNIMAAIDCVHPSARLNSRMRSPNSPRSQHNSSNRR
jgi:hypothetical protein